MNTSIRQEQWHSSVRTPRSFLVHDRIENSRESMVPLLCSTPVCSSPVFRVEEEQRRGTILARNAGGGLRAFLSRTRREWLSPHRPVRPAPPRRAICLHPVCGRRGRAAGGNAGQLRRGAAGERGRRGADRLAQLRVPQPAALVPLRYPDGRGHVSDSAQAAGGPEPGVQDADRASPARIGRGQAGDRGRLRPASSADGFVLGGPCGQVRPGRDCTTGTRPTTPRTPWCGEEPKTSRWR